MRKVRDTIPPARLCCDPDLVANVAASFGDTFLPRVPPLVDYFQVETPSELEAEMLKETVNEGRCVLAH